MAILWVEEYWPDQHERSMYPKRVRTYRRHFKARFDDLLDNPGMMADHPDCPQLSDTWEDPRGAQVDEDATCVRVNCRRDPEGALLFYAECQYTTDLDLRNKENDPLLRPPEVDFSSLREQASILKDRNGRPVLNSARDYPEPAQEKPVDILVLTITRFLASYDALQANKYSSAINSDELVLTRKVDGLVTPTYTFAPGQAKIQSIRCKSHYENNIEYFQVTIEVHFNVKDGWHRQLLDQGYQERDPDTGKKFEIVDALATAGGHQHLLNGMGRKIERAQTVLYPLGADAFQTAINVAIMDDFPDVPWIAKWGGYFIVVDKGNAREEIMKVVDIAGGGPGGFELTVERAQKKTEAVEHSPAAKVELEPIFFTFEIEDELPFSIFNWALD